MKIQPSYYMKIKKLFVCVFLTICMVGTLQARESFNPATDILIAQFDGQPDADDIHSQAALGCLLLHDDLAGTDVYAVMGAVGTQGGTFIDSTELFNLIFGQAGSENWTDAKTDWNASVTRIKNKVRPVLDAGGRVWVQEAGQSNITADWVQALIDDGVALATISNQITVVQHSEWNENQTAGSDLTFVKNHTDYVKIDDGNSPNATPDWHLDDTAYMNEIFIGKATAAAEARWLLADQIVKNSGFSASYSSIDEGGVDFSDCVENWWIFELGSDADTVRKFWDRYVIEASDTAENAFIEDGGIIAFEVESQTPVSPWSQEASASGYSGDGYFRGTSDSFNQGGLGTVSYPIQITTSGRYQLQWRSRITFGSSNTEHNDSFARLTDAQGSPINPVPNSHTATGNWYKAYMNLNGSWDWQTSNLDNDPKSLSWNLEADTLYYFQISVRSEHHALDRVVLWDHARHNLSSKTTGKSPNNSVLNGLANSEFRSPTTSARFGYIYGDVAADGTIPSSSAPAYDQMLLDDTGNTGLSQFKAMVESEGYTITQHYDANTVLDAAFLNQYEVIIFGLHQKIWSSQEKAALDTWLRAGGSALFYSDSAAGGLWSSVGPQNPVGQMAVNNVISAYGMEVLVDQADGVTAYRAGPDATHPIVQGRPVFEGEGVSPVAVDPNSTVEILIPYANSSDYKVSGNATISHTQNITISNPDYAALAFNRVGDGMVMAIFDRQPLWNNGPGSDINRLDNLEVLTRIIRYMAGDLAATTTTTTTYTLSVTGGSGDGEYEAGAVVAITAAAAPVGQAFEAWAGDTLAVADANSASTTVTMPASAVSVTATYAANNTGDVLYALNSGGQAFTSSDGTAYSADENFTGGTAFDTPDPIAGTSDDAIYQSERWGNFTYNIPIVNGTYDVLLQFAEIYQTTDNGRVFDVQIEGTTVVDDIDLHALVGHDTKHDVLISGVVVSDGVLSIALSATTDNPKLSAFRILSISSPYTSWTSSTFTDDFTETALTSDPDGDGFINLLEFAFGMDPTLGALGSLTYVQGGSITRHGTPFLLVDSIASDTYHAVFGRRKDHQDAGLTYTSEFSADLTRWTSSSTPPTVLTSASSEDDIEVVRIPYPASVPVAGGEPDQEPRFFRIEVSSSD